MDNVMAVAIYIFVWWIVLFAVLPFGVRTQAEDGNVVPGTPESAPAKQRMLRIFLINTVVATIVFAIVYVIVVYKLITPDSITLPNTKIELLEPLGEGSPIAKFLERNPDGGIHHVCYEVDDIRAARDRLKADGARVLGDGEPKIGAHGKPVLFLHPKDFCGTLVEIEQA